MAGIRGGLIAPVLAVPERLLTLLQKEVLPC
jgi:hypothetical protein